MSIQTFVAGVRDGSHPLAEDTKKFGISQAKLAGVLLLAWIGNRWEPSYPRNSNSNPWMFWITTIVMIVWAYITTTEIKSKEAKAVAKVGEEGAGLANNKDVEGGESEKLQEAEKPVKMVLLGREQTEEWKGWMQWVFIMYHYYRARYVYNEIRVFVSSYVWMTGFGNFLYFEKSSDFSYWRLVSMLVRINWFPVMLCLFVGGSMGQMELYYVVPLHTVGFVATYATQYFIQKYLDVYDPLGFNKDGEPGSKARNNRFLGIAACLVVQMLIFETPIIDGLFFWSHEYHFRFSSDKYSAWQGMISAMFLKMLTEKANELENSVATLQASGTASKDEVDEAKRKRNQLQKGQISAGVALIALWYFVWGREADKHIYNPVHPYVLILPLMGYLLIRNYSCWATTRYSAFLEFAGRHTLETYVLQFHLFMTRDVQHILCLIPGSTVDGNEVIKAINMAVVGCIFVGVSVVARESTVVAQGFFMKMVTHLTASSDVSVVVEKGTVRVVKKGEEAEGVKNMGGAEEEAGTSTPATSKEKGLLKGDASERGTSTTRLVEKDDANINDKLELDEGEKIGASGDIPMSKLSDSNGVSVDSNDDQRKLVG